MKKWLLLCCITMLVTNLKAQAFKNLPDGDPYPGYERQLKVDEKLGIVKNRLRQVADKAAYPDHWNTGTQRYFPPIINQGGYGSCGVSSHVGHMLTSEMNAYYNTDASLPSNQLTPMFEYPFTYNGPGKDEMALYVGYPTADIYGGRYESSIYGGSEYRSNSWGWCTGYDLFYNAMKNRMVRAANFPASVATPEGAAALKAYLYNHAGDPDFGGRGGTACIGVGIGRSARARIPANPINDNIGVSGQEYILHWNIGGYDHAMCIVGYDDRIQFDLDANGKPGETVNEFGQNENGAWIIANSWGSGWGNKGFIYCPYALSAGVCAKVTNSVGKECYKTPDGQGSWQPYVYYFRKGYTPVRTMKVRMQYSKRSEISVRVGVSRDTTATVPEHEFQFQYINYTGDGDGNGIDAETPLLGRWRDGVMHTEPMEFGIDLTDLTDKVGRRRPLKYFLIVDSKASANGIGKILNASVLDYEFNAKGVETLFREKDVTIQTAGSRTMLSVVVNGEAFNSPLNLTFEGNTLRWQTPAGTLYIPTKYLIYEGEKKIGITTEHFYTLEQPTGVYTVRAVYVLDGKEYLSEPGNSVFFNPSTDISTIFDNNIISLNNASFYIPDVVKAPHRDYTVEMWFRPTRLHNWGDFLFYGDWGPKYSVHTNASGAVVAGWDLGSERISTPNGVLHNGEWAHIAVVIEGRRHYIYVNGKLQASGTAEQHSGFPSFWAGRLYFGNKESLNGDIDEIRLWSCARTAEEIHNNMYLPVARPALMKNLEAYLKMDTYQEKTTTRIVDHAQGHDAVVIQGVTPTTVANGQTISQTIDAPATAQIEATDEAVRGQAIRVSGHGNVGVTTYRWTATHANPMKTTIDAPSFVFNVAGEQTLTLTTTDINGKSATKTKTIRVIEVQPSADFSLSTDTVRGNDPVSVNALNRAPGCRYQWQMPGADRETAETSNATICYTEPGEKTITLTVTDASGKSITQTRKLIVKNTVPVIKYGISPTVVTVGEPVLLTDMSNYHPTIRSWSFKSNNHIMTSTVAEGTLIPDKAGVYDLTLTVGNEMGTTMQTDRRALIVCNAPSKTGLNFYSKEETQTLTIQLPTSALTEWTMEFWMNPQEFSTPSNGIYISGNGRQLVIESDASGNVSIAAGTTLNTLRQVYRAGEWHHYAFTRLGNTLTLYRDGVRVGTYQSDVLPDMGKIVLGGETARMYGMIDELRIWAKAHATDLLQKDAIEPIRDITAAKQEGLKIYYTFDQSLGDAEDACGTAAGQTQGFDNLVGWYADSKGVFALNFDTPSNEQLIGNLLPRNHFEPVGHSTSDGDTHEATAAFDDNMQTWWISSSAARLPQWVMFRNTFMDTVRSIRLRYNANYDFRAANVSIEQSDDRIAWEPLDIGHELFNFQQQNIVLAKPATKTYIRLTVNSTIRQETKANINEMEFYGDVSSEHRYFADIFDTYYTIENKRWGDWYYDDELKTLIDAYRSQPTAESYNKVMEATKRFVEPAYPVTLYSLSAEKNMGVVMPDTLYGVSRNENDLMQLWEISSPGYRKLTLRHLSTNQFVARAVFGPEASTRVGNEAYQYTVDMINDSTVAFHNGERGNNYLRFEPNNGGHYFNSWGNNKEFVFREIETLTIPLEMMGAHSFATCYLPFGVHIDGAVAYALDYNEDKTRLITRRMGEEIPANTPMLLVSMEGNEVARLTIDKRVGGVYSTVLNGTLVPMDSNAARLILGNRNGMPGFYPWNGGVLSAGQCFLVKDEDMSDDGLEIDINDIVLTVDKLHPTISSDTPRYNLSGQKVNLHYKGIVIVNGRKYQQ